MLKISHIVFTWGKKRSTMGKMMSEGKNFIVHSRNLVTILREAGMRDR